MEKINHYHRLLHLRWQLRSMIWNWYYWCLVRHRIVGQFVYPFFCGLCFLELLGWLLGLVGRKRNSWNRLRLFCLFKEVVVPRKADTRSWRRWDMHVMRVCFILDWYLNSWYSLHNSYRRWIEYLMLLYGISQNTIPIVSPLKRYLLFFPNRNPFHNVSVFFLLYSPPTSSKHTETVRLSSPHPCYNNYLI